MMKTAGIYIHIPFCKSKCIYCDFVSYAGKEALFDEYTAALCTELTLQAKKFADVAISSVYFGGGTPSVLEGEQIGKILQTVRDNYRLEKNCEITAEINPGTVSEQKVKEFVAAGINRCSIGLQTASDAILKIIGRPHNRKQFVATVALLRKYGIENISADIMLGLPKQDEKSVDETLKLLLELDLPHVSAYALKVENRTPLQQMVKQGKILLPSEDQQVDFYDQVFSTLEEHKIYRYEVSNFAKVGFESRHNLNYWNWGRYLGVGVNASSFINDTRQRNVANLEKYLARLKEGKVPISERHKLTLQEAEMEFIMLALRKESGLDIGKFNEIFHTDFIRRFDEKLKKLEKIGVIVYDKDYVNVKKEKMYVLNSVLVEILQ